jgi:DNA polymerase beta
MEQNYKIIDYLEKLIWLLRNKKEKNSYFKIKAFENALKQIKNVMEPITSSKQIAHLKHIGISTQSIIDEILQTQHLKRVDNDNVQKWSEVQKLLQIHGIGVQKANQLVDQNISINNIENHLHLLNRMQKNGYSLYRRIERNIPRKEMTIHLKCIRNMVSSVNPHFIIDMMGSYRRGNQTSNDIDILITIDPKHNIDISKIIPFLIEKMDERKYIKHIFSRGKTKLVGVSSLSPFEKTDTYVYPYRRIDIMVTPYDEYPFTVLYFTGSSKFNTSMRANALKQGYSLSEKGLKDMKTGQFLSNSMFPTELSIFQFLGQKYVHPSKRF